MGMAYHSPLKPRFLIELENAGFPLDQKPS